MSRHVICALDTSDFHEARDIVQRLSPTVRSFKVGHGLTLPHGLEVISRLQEAGAERIFLDLKFHDIPNSVALAVREACQHRVWMMTLHTTGGAAMMTAAVDAANVVSDEHRPLLIGVSVLTSLDESGLAQIGVTRTVQEQMTMLSKLAMECELDGVVCSAHELKPLRAELGPQAVLVTPGIRVSSGPMHDQKRVGEPNQALQDGADYLVIGRALVGSNDPAALLKDIETAASAR